MYILNFDLIVGVSATNITGYSNLKKKWKLTTDVYCCLFIIQQILKLFFFLILMKCRYETSKLITLLIFQTVYFVMNLRICNYAMTIWSKSNHRMFRIAVDSIYIKVKNKVSKTEKTERKLSRLNKTDISVKYSMAFSQSIPKRPIFSYLCSACNPLSRILVGIINLITSLSCIKNSPLNGDHHKCGLRKIRILFRSTCGCPSR